jgi:quercetin dioxygenase-like cupin family protein
MKRLAFISTLVAWALAATIALATPGSLVVATPIARATFGGAINTGQIAGRQSVIQQLTIAPGGHTGWHTHPGGTVILVQAGTFSLYNDACAKTVAQENRGVVEAGGHIQLARNEGSGLLLLTVVYFDVPVGGAVRSDAATPACAAGADANNLPEGPAGSGISFRVPGGVVQRATFAATASITGGAERDVFVQHQTYAPGGHSGWHSHPGATVIYVESGTMSFYTGNCVRQTFTAGQGAVEPADQLALARNEGTVPLVLRVVYFNVPVAGSPRIDQPEPTTCTGLVGGTVAMPPSLPSTSAETIDSAGPRSAIIALLVALASVVGLAVLGRTRRRSRTS